MRMPHGEARNAAFPCCDHRLGQAPGKGGLREPILCIHMNGSGAGPGNNGIDRPINAPGLELLAVAFQIVEPANFVVHCLGLADRLGDFCGYPGPRPMPL